MNYPLHGPIEIWVIIAGLTAMVFLTRNALNLFGDRFKLPNRLSQALDYAPLAALVAIVVPEFVRTYLQLGNSVSAHLADGRLIAGIILVLVGLATRNAMYALMAGGLSYGFALFCS